MAWNSSLTLLRDVLADLYFTIRDTRRVIEQAGLDPKYMDLNGQAINIWHDVLREAQKHNKVQAIVNIAQAENPQNPYLNLAKQDHLLAAQGADIRSQINWHSTIPIDQLEKITGAQSTLLPISFLEVGLQKARAVVRVVRADGASGSGFLTDGNLLITNNHVLATPAEATGATIQFNYQKSASGLDAPVAEAKLAPDDGFASSIENDWTAIRIQGTPNAIWGALTLIRMNPRANDWVNIIQHPGGGPKQIALYHNVVVYADNKRVQYLTDTLPGSSGSPVFNTNWQIVALHHTGGWLRESESKQVYYRNQGIHINIVIDGLIEAGLYPD